MTVNTYVIIGVIVWLLCVLLGLAHWLTLEAQASGGWDSIGAFLVFLMWQAGALGIALIVLVIRLVGRAGIMGRARWLGFIPIVASGGFAAFVVGVYVYTAYWTG